MRTGFGDALTTAVDVEVLALAEAYFWGFSRISQAKPSWLSRDRTTVDRTAITPRTNGYKYRSLKISNLRDLKVGAFTEDGRAFSSGAGRAFSSGAREAHYARILTESWLKLSWISAA